MSLKSLEVNSKGSVMNSSMDVPEEPTEEAKTKNLKRFAYRKVFFSYKGMNGVNEWDDSSNVKKMIRKLRMSLKINDSIAALIGISGLVVAWYESELYYEAKVQPQAWDTDIQDTNDPFIFSLRLLVTGSTIALIFFQYFHSTVTWLIDVEKGRAEVGISYFKTKYFRSFIRESILYGIHAPPIVDHVMEIDDRGHAFYLSANQVILIVMLIRTSLGMRLFSHYVKWRNEEATQICEDEGCEASEGFALKAIIQENPYPALIALTSLSVFQFGVALRNFERPYNDAFGFESGDGQEFSYMINAVWCVIITMTTVGYGDFFAQSMFGMVVTLGIIFIGIFLVSLMVVTLTNSIQLDGKENRAFNILFRLKTREILKNKAALIVVQIIKIIGFDKDYERKRENPKFSKQEMKEIYREYDEHRGEMRSQLEIYKMSFADTRKTLKPNSADPAEEMRKMCNIIEADFTDLANYYLMIKQLEANQLSIRDSHFEWLNIINDIHKYNDGIEELMDSYKDGIFYTGD